jgi:DNA-binding Xre family transcriptional regulator
VIDAKLPHSPELERAYLGGLILGGEGFDLEVSDFYLPFHRALYRKLLELRRDGKPTADLALIAGALSATELDEVGGIAYLAGLLDGVPRASNLSHYSKELKQKSLLRRVITVSQLNTDKLLAANGDAKEVLREVLNSFCPYRDEVGQNRRVNLKACSVPELLRMDVKPREMLLHPFLPAQGLAMLYSKRGVGKTFISLGISAAAAGGRRFLKWNAPTPRKVLYVDGEMPLSALQQRVSDILAGTDIDHPLENLQFITPDLHDRGLPDLSTVSGQDEIETHLEGVSLLVLDNLSSLVRAVKENEGEGWLPVQDWALDLRRRGISVLFVHHAGKGGAQRGTSRREDLLDSVVTLKHPTDYLASEGLRCIVDYEKSRGFYGEDARSFEVRMSAGPSGEAVWTVTDCEASAKSRARDLLAAGMSVRDVAEEVGISKSAVQRLKNNAQGEVSQGREGR